MANAARIHMFFQRFQCDLQADDLFDCGVFWPKGSFTKNPGTADVYIGQPIQAGHQTIASLNDQAKRWIDQHKQNYLVNKD